MALASAAQHTAQAKAVLLMRYTPNDLTTRPAPASPPPAARDVFPLPDRPLPTHQPCPGRAPALRSNPRPSTTDATSQRAQPSLRPAAIVLPPAPAEATGGPCLCLHVPLCLLQKMEFNSMGISCFSKEIPKEMRA